MPAQCDAIDAVSLLNWKKTEALPLPVNWDTLQRYTLRLRRSRGQGSCSTFVLLPQYTMGGLHLVRLADAESSRHLV
ncbi:hypothetical protein HRG_014273 [Hirsutella rhossiliensis]